MKVLVTGANGFIGRAVCRDLQQKHHEVLPVVRHACSLPNAVMVKDENDPKWDSLLEGCQTVIHLAGRAHVAYDNSPDTRALYISENVELTLNLARKAAKQGVKRFVFVSSIKVNGEQTIGSHAFSEEDTPNPQDLYAESKLLAERGLIEIAATCDLEVVIIRPPLVYGPGVKGNFLALIRLIKKGIPLPLGGIPNQRSLIALDNLSNFICLCADSSLSPKARNQIFLVSDGQTISTSELIQKIAQAYELKLRLIPLPISLFKMVLKMIGKTAVADRILGSLVINDRKAREVLGWHPVVSMNEQLRSMVNDAMD